MKLKYVAVYEQTPNNYCAYLPDLPGCISTGGTWEEVTTMVREAVVFHIEGMLAHGNPLPERPMSLEEAETYHQQTLPQPIMENFSEYGQDLPSLSTTFEFVEVEVDRSSWLGSTHG